MFGEVVDWVLVENRDKIESSLDHIQELRAWLQGELEDLQWPYKDKSNPSAWKRMKKEMEQTWKDLKGLEATISKYKFHLREGHEDNLSNSGTKGAMAITPVADNALPASATPESLTSPPDEEQIRTMEVDDRDEHQTPASPVSHSEDDLLTGDTVVGVEGDMANLTVSSPRDGKGGD